MSRSPTVDDVRRIGAGAALIAAPLAFVLGTLLHPGLRHDAADQLALIGAHRAAWYWTHVLGFLAVILFYPAILALAGLVRERAPGWALAGTALGFAGLVGWGGVVTFFGFVGWQMAAAGDQAQMADLFRRLNETPGAIVPLRALSFGVVAGMLVLAVALVRTGAAPRWVAALIAAGFVQFAIGAPAAQTWLLTTGTAAMTLGLGTLGLRVLRGRPDVL